MAIIAIDFDGSCVTHAFPEVGHDIGAAPVLKQLVAKGHKLILWTVRANVENPTSDGIDPTVITVAGGNYLDDAVAWFKENEIPLWGINKNPSQGTWSTSPKAFAHVYIDDLALGAPLTPEKHIDWDQMHDILQARGYI